MLDRLSLFECKTPKGQFKKIKKIFLTQLVNTQERCTKLCDRKHDQERNFSVAYHPEIQKDRIKIKISISLILDDIEMIEKLDNPVKRLNSLIDYIKNLSELNFNLLFMQILTGKVRKHLMPILNQFNSTFLVRNDDDIHSKYKVTG